MKEQKRRATLERLIKESQRDERESLIWFESGRTVKSVDFQRIENNSNSGVPLSIFELEVKRKLASSPSPYDELVRIEEEEVLEEKEHAQRTKLGLLALRANLSPQEQACYTFFYEMKYSDETVQKRLGISQSHFCHLRDRIQAKLIKTHRKSSQRSYRKKKKGSRPLTERQREVLKLRKQGRTLKQISEQLGVSIVRVHQIIREGVKKFV